MSGLALVTLTRQSEDETMQGIKQWVKRTAQRLVTWTVNAVELAALKAAVAIARRHGLVLVGLSDMGAVLQEVDTFAHYTLTSGHLTRAFHAGHRARMTLWAVEDALRLGLMRETKAMAKFACLDKQEG